MIVCHYFDDEFIMNFGSMMSNTQRLSHRLSELGGGIRYNEKTRQLVSANPYVLGFGYDWP